MPTSPALSRLRNLGVHRRVRELAAFGVVGAVCFVIDVAVFQLFYAHVGVDAVSTKFLATMVSMTAAFVGHRFWSFAHRDRTGLRREYLRFAAVNGVTLLLGLAIVWFVRYPLGQESVLVLQGANVLAIFVGTVVRFLVDSRWVFPAVALGGGPNPLYQPDVAPDPRPVISRADRAGPEGIGQPGPVGRTAPAGVVGGVSGAEPGPVPPGGDL